MFVTRGSVMIVFLSEGECGIGMFLSFSLPVLEHKKQAYASPHTQTRACTNMHTHTAEEERRGRDYPEINPRDVVPLCHFKV